MRLLVSIALLIMASQLQAENLRWWHFQADFVVDYVIISCSDGGVTFSSQYNGGTGNVDTDSWLPAGSYTCWSEGYFGQLGYMKSNTVTKVSMGSLVSPPNPPRSIL